MGVLYLLGAARPGGQDLRLRFEPLKAAQVLPDPEGDRDDDNEDDNDDGPEHDHVHDDDNNGGGGGGGGGRGGGGGGNDGDAGDDEQHHASDDHGDLGFDVDVDGLDDHYDDGEIYQGFGPRMSKNTVLAPSAASTGSDVKDTHARPTPDDVHDGSACNEKRTPARARMMSKFAARRLCKANMLDCSVQDRVTNLRPVRSCFLRPLRVVSEPYFVYSSAPYHSPTFDVGVVAGLSSIV